MGRLYWLLKQQYWVGKVLKKRTVSALLMLLMIFLNMITVFGADDKGGEMLKPIKVGVYGMEGFAERNGDSGYKGYMADYLAQLGSECGYKIDVVLVDRESQLESLAGNECDVILTAENFEQYPGCCWSDRSVVKESGILYVREDADICFEEFDKFNNLQIGFCRDSIFEEDFGFYALDNGFDYETKYYDDENEMLLALENGEVGAALLGNLTYVDEEVKNVAVVGEHEYHFVGMKDRSLDIQAFDNAIFKFEVQNNPYIESIYSAAYWQSKGSYVSLTRKEQEYVKSHPIINVGYFMGSYPLQYTDDEGRFEGIARQFYDYFSDYTGFEFVYHGYSDSNACKQDLLDGKIDMIALVPHYTEWAIRNNLNMTDWYFQVPVYEIKLDSGSRAKSVGMTSAFAVGGQTNDKLDYVNYDSIVACLDAVKNGEIDAAYINSYSWMIYSDKPTYSMLEGTYRNEYISMSSVTGMSFDNISLNSIINKAISSITPELSKNRVINGVLFSEERTNPFVNIIVTYRLQICLVLVVIMVTVITLAVSAKKKKAQVFEKLAYTDPVTGGWNQTKFYKETDKIKFDDGKYAIGYINIENFKYINDFYGREQGDIVLKFMNQMLADMMQPDGIYARVLADRFVFLMPYIDYNTIKYNFETYISNIEINIAGFADSVIVKSTCGVYIAENEKGSVRDMVDKAAIAEKQTRDEAKPPIMLYDDTLNAEFIKNQEMTASMKKALENNEFTVFLQPKVDINSELPVGCEALVRWFSPEKGYIQPGDFIPLFEKNGFVTEVDFFVLEQVCKMLRRRIDSGLPVFPINVNQSRLHVNDRMYLSMLQDMLNKYDIPMNLVVFEITESAFIEDSHTMIGLINKMKVLGFNFSMDDFGSGYSSFNLLKDMPIDELKIDKGFLESTDDSKKSRYIIEKIVQMAHGLDIRVVCEGVERKEQVDFLRAIECDIVQGYYYSKPMPMEEYEKYLLQFDLKSNS